MSLCWERDECPSRYWESGNKLEMGLMLGIWGNLGVVIEASIVDLEQMKCKRLAVGKCPSFIGKSFIPV